MVNGLCTHISNYYTIGCLYTKSKLNFIIQCIFFFIYIYIYIYINKMSHGLLCSDRTTGLGYGLSTSIASVCLEYNLI